MNQTDLQNALDLGIISESYVRTQLEMAERKQLLDMHRYSIWEGSDGKWCTYIPGEKGRVFKKRKSKEEIEQLVCSYYKAQINEPCFREVYKEWIAEKEEYHEIKSGTVSRYNTAFKQFFVPGDPFCKIKLKDISDDDLELFIKRQICKHNLTVKTYAMLRILLMGVLKFARRKKYTEYSIAAFFRDFSLPHNIFNKKKQDAYQVFNDIERERMLKYLTSNPTVINLGIALQFYTGMRIGELSALTTSDIDDGIIHVHRTESTKEIDGHKIIIVEEDTKSDSGTRDIVIPAKAQTIVDRLKLRANSDWLFTLNGNRVTSRMFNYHLRKACSTIGIEPRSSHKIRKTYASLLLSNKVDDVIVQNQLGHKEVSTTRKYYYFNTKQEKEVREEISEALGL